MIDKLLTAVYQKDYDKIKELLQKGAKINDVDEDGRTSLMHAILADDADANMVNFLVQYGADVKLKDNEQEWTSLHFAARNQLGEIVKILINNGADVNDIDVFGNTPLWRCTMDTSPKIEVVEILIKNGADPNKKNKFGISPKDNVINIGNKEVLKIFEEV